MEWTVLCILTTFLPLILVFLLLHFIHLLIRDIFHMLIDEAISGGKLVIDVSYFGWYIYSETHDLCTETSCPVSTGEFLVSHSQVLPRFTPPVSPLSIVVWIIHIKHGVQVVNMVACIIVNQVMNEDSCSYISDTMLFNILQLGIVNWPHMPFQSDDNANNLQLYYYRWFYTLFFLNHDTLISTKVTIYFGIILTSLCLFLLLIK